LTVVNALTGGPGMVSHTNNLGEGESQPAFAMGSMTGSFDFSIEADADLIEQLKANQGRRVILRGQVDGYN